MARIALDTSVIIAGLLAWHERHQAALAALKAAGSADNEIVLPLPVLIESYSVMTRLPAPHRLRPADAFSILVDSFRKRAELTALSGDESWPLLQSLSADDIGGGRTYDAHILACARKAAANRLLTFNRRHFETLIDDDIELVVP